MLTRFDSQPVDANLAEAIAGRFRARRIRPGRWIAACPAHEDRSPSLSIAAGSEGKVLVRCFAGCGLAAVLKAAGLEVRDLFPGRPRLSPAEWSAMVTQRERAEQAHQQQRALEREAVEPLRRARRQLLNCLPNLGRQLALLPDGAPGDDALTREFHSVLDQIRWIDRVFLGDKE